MRFGNFILYYNFLSNSLKFIKSIHLISEREFHKEDKDDIDFSPKITIFEKIRKKTCFFFAIFLSKQARKKIKFWKWLSKCLIDLKHSFGCWIFSFLQVFTNFWVSCQIRQKFYFFVKFSNCWPFLACNFKNRHKRWKIRKCNMQMNVLSQSNLSKAIFF